MMLVKEVRSGFGNVLFRVYQARTANQANKKLPTSHCNAMIVHIARSELLGGGGGGGGGSNETELLLCMHLKKRLSLSIDMIYCLANFSSCKLFTPLSKDSYIPPPSPPPPFFSGPIIQILKYQTRYGFLKTLAD